MTGDAVEPLLVAVLCATALQAPPRPEACLDSAMAAYHVVALPPIHSFKLLGDGQFLSSRWTRVRQVSAAYELLGIRGLATLNDLCRESPCRFENLVEIEGFQTSIGEAGHDHEAVRLRCPICHID